MYKAGQGMPSRIGTMIVGVLIAFYASYSWFRWHPLTAGTGLNVDFILSIIMLLAITGFFGWLAFRSPQSSDYLIDMDDELRKVVWPAALPLFDPKTEAWGSTYVVIVCAIIFTVFIWIVDLLFQYTITYGLFQNILFAK